MKRSTSVHGHVADVRDQTDNRIDSVFHQLDCLSAQYADAIAPYALVGASAATR
jgi:hypothetical protein